MKKLGKYLVYVDKSESSRAALHFACKKAQKSGSSVEILYVIPPADPQMFGVAGKMRGEQKQEAEILVKAFSETAFQYAGITPGTHIREGRLSEEIINATLEDNDVNMLVVGASQDTAERISLINWLAEKMGDRMLIPMMLVPGNLTDLQIDELS